MLLVAHRQHLPERQVLGLGRADGVQCDRVLAQKRIPRNLAPGRHGVIKHVVDLPHAVFVGDVASKAAVDHQLSNCVTDYPWDHAPDPVHPPRVEASTMHELCSDQVHTQAHRRVLARVQADAVLVVGAAIPQSMAVTRQRADPPDARRAHHSLGGGSRHPVGPTPRVRDGMGAVPRVPPVVMLVVPEELLLKGSPVLCVAQIGRVAPTTIWAGTSLEDARFADVALVALSARDGPLVRAKVDGGAGCIRDLVVQELEKPQQVDRQDEGVGVDLEEPSPVRVHLDELSE